MDSCEDGCRNEDGEDNDKQRRRNHGDGEQRRRNHDDELVDARVDGFDGELDGREIADVDCGVHHVLESSERPVDAAAMDTLDEDDPAHYGSKQGDIET